MATCGDASIFADPPVKATPPVDAASRETTSGSAPLTGSSSLPTLSPDFCSYVSEGKLEDSNNSLDATLTVIIDNTKIRGEHVRSLLRPLLPPSVSEALRDNARKMVHLMNELGTLTSLDPAGSGIASLRQRYKALSTERATLEAEQPPRLAEEIVVSYPMMFERLFGRLVELLSLLRDLVTDKIATEDLNCVLGNGTHLQPLETSTTDSLVTRFGRSMREQRPVPTPIQTRDELLCRSVAFTDDFAQDCLFIRRCTLDEFARQAADAHEIAAENSRRVILLYHLIEQELKGIGRELYQQARLHEYHFDDGSRPTLKKDIAQVLAIINTARRRVPVWPIEDSPNEDAYRAVGYVLTHFI